MNNVLPACVSWYIQHLSEYIAEIFALTLVRYIDEKLGTKL